VVEALRAGVPASALQVAHGADRDPRLTEAVHRAAEAGVAVLEVPRVQLDRLAAGNQGLALSVRAYSYLHPDDLLARADASGEPALIVACDSVTDARNLGAIVRSVAAFGGHGVLVPERRAAGVNAGAWKASAGALARVPVARATNLTRTLRGYGEAGLTIIGLSGEGDVDVSELELAVDPLVLVLGGEGEGLSRLVRESCEMLVGIRRARGVDSLNVAVAAGIALHEVARRRAS
jgi:23S rRNA (guanosine2251-2'-O)-methyltransferase